MEWKRKFLRDFTFFFFCISLWSFVFFFGSSVLLSSSISLGTLGQLEEQREKDGTVRTGPLQDMRILKKKINGKKKNNNNISQFREQFKFYSDIFHISPYLLESVCDWETREFNNRRLINKKQRIKARGDNGEAIGLCQVQIETARVLLGLSNKVKRRNIIALLESSNMNIFLAAHKLYKCKNIFYFKEGTVNCYNGSRRSRSPSVYSKNILVRYNYLKTLGVYK